MHCAPNASLDGLARQLAQLRSDFSAGFLIFALVSLLTLFLLNRVVAMIAMMVAAVENAPDEKVPPSKPEVHVVFVCTSKRLTESSWLNACT